MISLFFSVHSNARGRGFWKLNTSFLKETEYVSQIKSTIQKTKEEYANDDPVDPSLLWEMVKLKVRESSINFGIKKKKKMASEQNEIEQSVAILEKRISDASVDDSQKQNLWVQLETEKQELERIVEYQTKGAVLRSKSRWYNEGEKNTKYFLNLEKRHCKQATIAQLKIDVNAFALTDKEILSQCETFYKDLYSTKTAKEYITAFTFAPHLNEKVLNKEERLLCEGLINEKEGLEALKNMTSDKTPGTDGLQYEFYKVFWRDVSQILISALNYSYAAGKLSVSQRRGVIKLIPKKIRILIW